MFEFLELEEGIGKFWHRLVGSTSSMPVHPESAVTYDEVRPFLATCFRGFGGEATAQLGPAHVKTATHRLRIRQPHQLEQLEPFLVGLGEERTAWAARDGGTVMVPPAIALFPDRRLNRDMYVWLAAYMASMPQRPNAAHDPLIADLGALDAAKTTVSTVLGEFPGLAPRYAALCRALLQQRRRAALPPVEQLVENRISGMLARGAGVSDSSPPAIFPRAAPAGYKPMMAVPLWPCFERRAEISSGEGDEEARTATANGLDGAGSYRADRGSDRTADRSPFILNRFEKILAMAEMVNVDRPTDDKDDTDQDAARDLDEIRLGRRKERPSSKFRFDLDLPPEAVQAGAISASITYPEWNYRTAQYMPSYCEVVCGPAAMDVAEASPTDEQRSLVRSVRKQFEILRPKNEVLKGQIDGSELDLDAVVRRRADLAAGGDGSDRIHLLSRPQGHDMAVTTLVDVSLSTDAWFDDHRVLDVEKQALSVLANGLAACGTNHSILTFTSRRRSWVRIETVKAFGEDMSGDVERRIASLKPGYYTRIGAAIRHATAELAKQSNRTKLLLVLTDGKPNDIDHYEGRFALEDSRKAVIEARRNGVAVFAVTIDRDARSYLPSMFGRNGFAIVGDIGKLPKTLPAIYRGLTRLGVGASWKGPATAAPGLSDSWEGGGFLGGPAEGAARRVEIGIEGRGHGPDHETVGVINPDDAIGDRDQAFAHQLGQAVVFAQKVVGRKAVGCRDGGNVGDEVAHQPLDDMGSELVFFGDAIALRGCERPCGDAPGVTAGRHFVLDVAAGEPPDGRCAEADQVVAVVGGVALEVPPQRSPLRCVGEFILGQGEVVEADPEVARSHQRRGNGFGLLVARHCIRQHGFVDQALVLLERGDMGISEDREAIRPHGKRCRDRVDTGLHSLVRQAVDQVEVDA